MKKTTKKQMIEVRRWQDKEFSFRNVNFEMIIRLSSLGVLETF